MEADILKDNNNNKINKEIEELKEKTEDLKKKVKIII